MKNVMYLLLLFPLLLVAQNPGKILNMTEITVKSGHNSQFKAAVKLYKECYEKNNGTEGWNLWQRFQGEGTVYVLTSMVDNWAAFDKEDKAGDDCQSFVTTHIMPHVEKISYSTARNLPDLSRAPLEGTKMVVVYSVKVNNATAFEEGIKERQAFIRRAEGSPRSYIYRFMGGHPDSPSYLFSTPFKSFADMDIQRDNIWKIIEKEKGLKVANQMREANAKLVEKEWSYLYILHDELSK
ncbi:hypothetical protein [Flavobacterium orientale]|uniref:Uncharacterized protein n=1 Tax=Flavobacterium orientale TaxID=1756020 RepID=A0A917DEB1_9FLAO|nr:hypothetical protein [Flavobacterium orientale]GGD30335.1 hypothetical protein GCM10011343_20620 [Flavobacterium orientale]